MVLRTEPCVQPALALIAWRAMSDLISKFNTRKAIHKELFRIPPLRPVRPRALTATRRRFIKSFLLAAGGAMLPVAFESLNPASWISSGKPATKRRLSFYDAKVRAL